MWENLSPGTRDIVGLPTRSEGFHRFLLLTVSIMCPKILQLPILGTQFLNSDVDPGSNPSCHL